MRIILLILNSFIALTAIVCGLMMIIEPSGGTLVLPLSLLNTSPFKDFFIPGVILAGFVGVTNLIAALYTALQYKNWNKWTLAAGIMITSWIVVQMLMIQVFHWFQFLYLGAGLFIILISYQLKKKWLV